MNCATIWVKKKACFVVRLPFQTGVNLSHSKGVCATLLARFRVAKRGT